MPTYDRPGRYALIQNEEVELSPDAPAGWDKGTPLRGLHAQDLNAQGRWSPIR
jgi:hypothetical protein